MLSSKISAVHGNDIFIKYSVEKSSKSMLNIANTKLEGLYVDATNSLYNFISGRTLSYLQKAFIAYMELNINDQMFLNKIIDGLVGAGTCSFNQPSDGTEFRELLHTQIGNLSEIMNPEEVNMPSLTNDISKDVSNFILSREKKNVDQNEIMDFLSSLLDEIYSQFDIQSMVNNFQMEYSDAKFISMMDSVIELKEILVHYPDFKEEKTKLENLISDYYGLYCDIMEIYREYEKIFGKKPVFKRAYIIKDQDTKDKYKFTYNRVVVSTVNRNIRFYSLDKDQTIFNATKSNEFLPSSKATVLVWNNDNFEFVSLPKFKKRYM